MSRVLVTAVFDRRGRWTFSHDDAVLLSEGKVTA
jgi:hypothetical protein